MPLFHNAPGAYKTDSNYKFDPDTLNFENNDSSLLMINLPKGKASFGIVSYVEILEKPLVLNPNNMERNCSYFKYNDK
jgi:hypothetical protein